MHSSASWIIDLQRIPGSRIAAMSDLGKNPKITFQEFTSFILFFVKHAYILRLLHLMHGHKIGITRQNFSRFIQKYGIAIELYFFSGVGLRVFFYRCKARF
ncbi:hypothetical protein MQ089_11735 [Edwardsiella anguillarum]|uniref:hypothetical protein n=1 Tax=Edwardsiella anguillarum TaxID=1821960 RepID=UPI0024B7EEF7|nr:hypothetical protein [Edwardsiella anguillarum]WHP79132.1 hypothetical protein MQ090_11430 [Edwardsiella anguillarum]WHQ16590.1 hypothetical protein MQ085_11735 [Edwardsiella anguillarum]WHQ20126.1 hypothetical protein MQ089_11735 [Edwardsiella anguillarum]WHQ23647.1 hypothetical protein MQ094_11745 [Edwardsiella anguillarum]WHQ27217.1 hypothetical protein MQ093_11960 [Edwardsiella anguillarum]